MSSRSPDELLRIEGIRKTFPGVVALDSVDFDLRRGEVHVLLGENGAGKSTLIKMLSGAYTPDAGRILAGGEEVRVHGAQDSERLGIATIYQEFNLVPDLTVAENIFLGRQPRRFGMIDRKRMDADAEVLLERVGVKVSPRARVRELGIAGKASGTLIGALILAVLRNGLNLLSVSAFWQQVVIGVVIALAVLFDTLRRKAGAVTPAAGASGGGGRGKQALTYVIAAVVAVAVVGATSLLHNGSSGGKNQKIGLSLSTLNNPFFVQIRNGAQEEAKKLGVDLTVTDAQNDASQQANQLQNFVSGSLSAVVVNPVDSDAAGPSVRSANKDDIPVIAVDRGVNKADTSALVASDNVEGGKLGARALAEKLGGNGTIVILQGQAGTSASRERGAGFAAGLKEYPGIKVVAKQPADFDRTKGLDVMTNLLQAHPDVDGVFAENDEMALGAIKALGSKAGKSVQVVGFDGTPDGLKAVQDGTLYASVAQQPKELGRIAVQNALRAAEDKKVERTVKVPVKVVTQENVAGFEG
ncbi:HTH-type transcriptional repressor PurR [Streptomyces tendae]